MLARLIIKSLKCWASLRATTQSFKSRSRKKCALVARSGASRTECRNLMSPLSASCRAIRRRTDFTTEGTMTEQAVTKIVGAVYAAFATMLSDEGLALMNDTLRFAAATGSEEGKRILRLIADATERPSAIQ